MKIRRLIGVVALLICAGLVSFPVVGGFSMAGFHAGLVLFTGLGGMLLLIG